MRPNVPTLWSIKAQSAAMSNEPYVADQYSTVNEKLLIEVATAILANDRPVINSYIIGNGNHFNITNQGISVPKNKGHYADSAVLYNQLPFALRPITNDFDAVTRAKYSLRKTVVYGGVSYYAYFGKRISMAAIPTELWKVSQVNNQVVAVPYVVTDASQNPTPPPVDANGNIITSGEYLRASKLCTIVFDETDAEEFRNVGDIIYGDSSLAMVTEIGICQGIDKNINITSTLGGTTFLESLRTQVASFCPALSFSDFSTKGFTFNTLLGGTAPLLGAEQILSGTVQDYTP